MIEVVVAAVFLTSVGSISERFVVHEWPEEDISIADDWHKNLFFLFLSPRTWSDAAVWCGESPSFFAWADQKKTRQDVKYDSNSDCVRGTKTRTKDKGQRTKDKGKGQGKGQRTRTRTKDKDKGQGLGQRTKDKGQRTKIKDKGQGQGQGQRTKDKGQRTKDEGQGQRKRTRTKEKD